MKLEEGMYVRTKKGKIYKFKSNNSMARVPYMINCSYNIIDLIKIGDYVNGFKVTGLDYQYTTKVHKLSCNNEYGQEGILIIPSEIRNVVTKEQFDSITYEVEK